MNSRLKIRVFLLGVMCVAVASFVRAGEIKRLSVTEAGAVGDGVTVNTKTIQAAIDQCAAAGGVLVIPKGTFLSGALYFKLGVNLLIEKDAVLKSTATMADFPPIYTRWEGIERYWTPAFLNFIGMKNVEVSGEGLIDGSGDEWLRRNPRARNPPAAAPGQNAAAPASPAPSAALPSPAASPIAMSAAALPKPAEVYPDPLPVTAALNFAPDAANLPIINAAGIALPRGRPSPPRAVVFQDCSGVRVSGLHLKNQARWGFVFIYCEDVVAEKLIVRAEHNIPSSDSMDVDSCRRVLITGCDFDCNDDCLSIKSGKDEDGRRVNRPSEDIVVEKTRFAYGHGGAAMGSETSGGIRRVEVRDCIAEAGNFAPIRFKSQPTRGGVVEDITYRNMELRGVRQAVEFSLDWNMRIATPGAASMLPTVRNVKLINIHGTANSVGAMRGLKDSPVTNVVFENCHFRVQRGLVLENVQDIHTEGLTIDVEEGEPITRR